MRKIPDDEAKKLKHDTPSPPSEEDEKEFKRQLKEEQEHGHPAFKAKPPKENE